MAEDPDKKPDEPGAEAQAGGGPGGASAGAGVGISPSAEPKVRREKKDDWDDVPKLPYNRSLRLVWGDLIRIAMFVTMLIALITLRPHCSRGAAGFLESFAPPPDAGAVPVPEGYIRLTPEDVDKYFPRRGPEGESGPGAGGKNAGEAEAGAETEAEPETGAEPEAGIEPESGTK